MRQIFEPVFKKVCDLLERQLQPALTNKDSDESLLVDRMVIDKVVLVGGFADSIALQNQLAEVIKNFNAAHHLSIKLIKVAEK